MEERFKFPNLLKYISFALMAIGVAAFAYGFFTDGKRTWANYLLNNYYFLSLSVGAAFFFAIQYITQSGWSSAFKRVPEAMMAYIPFAAVFFLLLYFGMHDLYHWTHPDAIETDKLIAHKAPYLNTPFFYIRLVVFFGLWILMTRLLRKQSLLEDKNGGMAHFEKSEFYSKVMIFIFAFTFTLASVDWIMSIDVHWFSTLFPLKNFVAAFHHGSAIIILIVILLHERGHYKFLNKKHLHDFSRYMFMLAIIWGYFWFAQFMLIWYANIPEETFYYVTRWEAEWKFLFWANIVLNWAIPFVILMPKTPARSKLVLKIVAIILIVGQWVDLYMQIMPGTVHHRHIGFIEIGTFAGYAGLFIFVVFTALSKANLIPINHPYLEESTDHHDH